MNPLSPYLFFNGNARQALEFYGACFDGQVQVMTYADAPDAKNCPKGSDPAEVMHGHVQAGQLTLMASDWPGHGAEPGNDVHLSIQCRTSDEIETLFTRLAEGGTVKQPLMDTFWGARFGMLQDRFGVHWMLNWPKG